MDVFLVWHIHHFGDEPVAHLDAEGNVPFLEGTDDEKLIGVYRSEGAAGAAVARTARPPGFRDEPSCFLINPWTLDEDHWDEGFVTV